MKTDSIANRERIDFEYLISTMIILLINYPISMLPHTLLSLVSIAPATRKGRVQLAARRQA